MLFDLLWGALCLGLLALLPFVYRAGVRDGKKASKPIPEQQPLFVTQTIPSQSGQEQKPEELARMASILHNINCYNGTGEGQQQIS